MEAARGAYDDVNLAMQTWQSLAGLAHITVPHNADFACVLANLSVDEIDSLEVGMVSVAAACDQRGSGATLRVLC